MARELDSRRSSDVPRGATSAAEYTSHDIDSRDADDCSCYLGIPAYPLECDMRASVDATAVFVMRATAPSTHATHSKFATTGTALSLSLTLAACSPGEQAASWNAATITFASKQTDEEPVLFSERHTCWPSLLMATIQATTLYEVDSYQVDSSIESTMKCHCAGLRQTQQTYGVAIIPRYTEKKERQKKHEMKRNEN